MTKEEAINKAIELEFGEGNSKSIRDHNYSIVKVAEHLYDLLQPSLPPNLDEAAEKYACRGYSHNADPYEEIKAYQETKDAFKSGAEWMAGQGHTFETIMQEDDVDELVPTCPDMYNHGYPCGDKVIIQIRKKTE